MGFVSERGVRARRRAERIDQHVAFGGLRPSTAPANTRSRTSGYQTLWVRDRSIFPGSNGATFIHCASLNSYRLTAIFPLRAKITGLHESAIKQLGIP
jgi:hypothetical protein